MPKAVFPLVIVMLCSCARTDIFYPPGAADIVSYDKNGNPRAPVPRKAIVLNGSDSLGATRVRITSNSLSFSNQGGIDNSTSTRETMRTARHGITWAGILGSVGFVSVAAQSAYNANQAASATSNAAASRAAAATAASKNATAVRLAEIAAAERAAAAAAQAAPAAGSTIQSTIPSVVTPVVPAP